MNILFVDDEQDILDGFRRTLFSYSKQHKFYFAKSAYEALNILDNKKLDLVISDFRMPMMNGFELLSIIKEKFPNIIRIILTGQSEEFDFGNYEKILHRIVFKPLDTILMKRIIDDAWDFKDLISNENLQEFINTINYLPSYPEIFFEIDNELNKDDVSFDKLSEIITKDPALTAEILKTVNCGFFGVSLHIKNIQQALSYLGIFSIKSIVAFLLTYENERIAYQFKKYSKRLAHRSLLVSNISRNIAKSLKYNNEKVESIFIAALLQNFGKLVLIQIPDFYENKEYLMKELNISETEAEIKLTKSNSDLVGAYLLGLWGFTSTVFKTVANKNNLNTNIIEVTPELILYISNSIFDSNESKFDLTIFKQHWNLIIELNLSEQVELWWNNAQQLKGINYA